MARVKLPEIEMPEVRLPDLRLRDVRLPDLRLPDVRMPDLELMSQAPFIRQRRRSNPIWVGVKFVLGLGLGFFVGCLVAALIAPSAGEDTRQAIRDRLPGGTPKLPDPATSSSGAVTRGMRVSAVDAGGGLSGRLEAAREAMATEQRETENALFTRFRRAITTGRASEV
jgi:hypothetical protein